MRCIGGTVEIAIEQKYMLHDKCLVNVMCMSIMSCDLYTCFV